MRHKCVIVGAALLATLPHEHWVDAPVYSGIVDDNTGQERVDFKVQNAKLTVKPDPKVDEKTRAQVQKDMDELTLERGKYPVIAFRSTNVQKIAEGQFRVDGTLLLHGVSRPVNVSVKREGESFTGRAVIRQTDFGIKPISMGGGMIRIKDPLDIDFQIFTAGREIRR